MNEFLLNKRNFFYLLSSVVLLARKRELEQIEGFQDVAFAVYYQSNYEKRVELPKAPNWNWKNSSAEAIFDQKISSHSFQATQQKGERLAESSYIIQSKIPPNGPELTLEQKRVSKILVPS